MPSSLETGPRLRSLTAGSLDDAFRGQKFRQVPDFFVPVPVAAANFSGANSGIWAFAVPHACVFLGASAIWKTAGTNTIRVKKVIADDTSAPGDAADTENVDISDTFDLTATANTLYTADPVVDDYVCFLEAGDKVALASSSGTASLAGGLVILQFAWTD